MLSFSSIHINEWMLSTGSYSLWIPKTHIRSDKHWNQTKTVKTNIRTGSHTFNPQINQSIIRHQSNQPWYQNMNPNLIQIQIQCQIQKKKQWTCQFHTDLAVIQQPTDYQSVSLSVSCVSIFQTNNSPPAQPYPACLPALVQHIQLKSSHSIQTNNSNNPESENPIFARKKPILSTISMPPFPSRTWLRVSVPCPCLLPLPLQLMGLLFPTVGFTRYRSAGKTKKHRKRIENN